MAVYGLLIIAIFLNVASLVSNQKIVADHDSIYPPDKNSICSDESLTKGYRCEDYDVSKSF